MEWFALTVKPNHESSTLMRLESRRFECYLPTYRARRKWSDRIKMVEAPLFPGYLFSRFSYENRAGVLNTLGVTSLVSFGNVPAPVPHEEIERIRQITNSGLNAEPWPAVRVGDVVRICNGSLTGLEGMLVREKGAFRVVVNVDLLQRGVGIEVDRHAIEPVAKAGWTPPGLDPAAMSLARSRKCA